jgi:hypothetical protein
MVSVFSSSSWNRKSALSRGTPSFSQVIWVSWDVAWQGRLPVEPMGRVWNRLKSLILKLSTYKGKITYSDTFYV